LKLIEEVEELGGNDRHRSRNTKLRMKKQRLENKLVLTVGKIIVGVNKYRLETEDPSDFRCRQPNGA
jgi:methylmalonyl-CoA mutase N-terminal domain/subunit